jgi:hypothetical protein
MTHGKFPKKIEEKNKKVSFILPFQRQTNFCIELRTISQIKNTHPNLFLSAVTKKMAKNAKPGLFRGRRRIRFSSLVYNTLWLLSSRPRSTSGLLGCPQAPGLPAYHAYKYIYYHFRSTHLYSHWTIPLTRLSGTGPIKPGSKPRS